MKESNKNNDSILYVILKGSMPIGGVETYIYNVSKDIVTIGGYVLIVMNKNGELDDSYDSLYKSPQIDVVTYGFSTRKILSAIKSKRIKRINIIAFETVRFALADIIKRRLKTDYVVSALYFVPHFREIESYPEDIFSGNIREWIRKRFEKIAHKMNNNDNIRYFDQVHVTEMTKRYRYCVHNETKQYLPSQNVKQAFFDEQRCIELSKRNIFNILAVSRLDFPHKGFIVGLVQAFGKLKNKYPQIILTIVGYGEGLSMLQEEINKLDTMAQTDIHLVGKVAYDELIKYYNDANVNVSLAGCLELGAKNGTLSLPVRHYSYTCETYGFLPDSKKFAMSSEPGLPVIDYLEMIINMDTSTYVSMCKKSFDAFRDSQSEIDRESLMTLSDGGNNGTLSVNDIFFLVGIRTITHVIKFFKKIQK